MKQQQEQQEAETRSNGRGGSRIRAEAAHGAVLQLQGAPRRQAGCKCYSLGAHALAAAASAARQAGRSKSYMLTRSPGTAPREPTR